MADAEKAALVGVLALSVSLKLWNILDPFRLGFHSDEAILGLMAMHFWSGEFAYFYYGQTFGGGLEYVLDCLFYALLPHGVAPLRVTSGLMMLGAELLVYFCAREVFVSTTARVATVLIFMCGSFVIPSELSQSHGVHLNNFLAFAVLLAVYLNADCVLPRPAILGFVVGIGYWVSNFIWVALVFTAIIPLLRGVPLSRYLRPDMLRRAGVFVVCMALGALPRLLYLFDPDGWNVVSPMGGYTLGSPDKVLNTASMLIYDGLPRFFLGDYAGEYPSFGRWVSTVWLLLICGTLVMATFSSHKARPLLWAVSGCSVATAALIVSNAYSYDSGWRYVWPLLFAMAFHTGYICDGWHTKGVLRKASITLPLLLVGVGGTIGFFTNIVTPRLITPKHNQYAPVIVALEANGCEYGFSFWEYAYPIDYLTREKIILESTGLTRIGSYGQQVAAARRRCYIFSRSGTASGASGQIALTAYWRQNGIGFTEEAFREVNLFVEQDGG
jgi:hypothetical protein